MGNDLADAIRVELRTALLAVYPTLEDAAAALGIPYKTFRRHLSPASKDRTARVSLDFVLDVVAHLEQVAGVDLAEIYRRAQISIPEDDTTPTGGSRRDYRTAARKRDPEPTEEQ